MMVGSKTKQVFIDHSFLSNRLDAALQNHYGSETGHRTLNWRCCPKKLGYTDSYRTQFDKFDEFVLENYDG